MRGPRFIKRMHRIVIFLTLIFAACTAAASQLAFGPRDINLGKIKKGEIVERTVKIYNTSSEKADILRIYSDCDCTDVRIDKKNIAPSGLGEFKLKFDSGKQDAGVFDKTIFVLYTGGEEQIKITGEVVPVNPLEKISAGQEKSAAAMSSPAYTAKRSAGGYIAYFYSAKCRECIKVKNILESFSRSNPGVEIKNFDIYDKESRLLLEAMAVMYPVANGQKLTAPVLFASDSSGNLFLQGEEIRFNALSGFFSAGSRKKNINANPPWEIASKYKEEAARNIEARFRDFAVLPVLFAGLVDGVNPCAFGAIVFFIAYLTMILKKTSAEIFWTGVNFILGVFAAYLLLGMGLMKFMSAVKGIESVSRIFYIAVGILTLALSALSFVDSYSVKRIEKGRPAKMILQLPHFFRWRIYGVIERYSKLGYVVLFAFLMGAVISLLEFFCTGQVYFPTIMYISGLPDYKTKAAGYLVLYSFMFVIPLILIFSLVFWGVKSDMIEMFGRKYMFAAKFLNGVVFLLLAVLIFITVK